MFRWWRSSEPSVLPSQAAYALWAAQYPAAAHNRLMELEQAALLALLPPLTAKIVLDLACGTGRYAQLAQVRGASMVIGCDNSLPMLTAGKLPHTALAPLAALPLKGDSIDVIVCGLAVGHVPALDVPLREMARVLKVGGMALVSDFHPFQALSGGQRTFRVGKQTFAVEHHIHLYSDYLRSTQAVGLQITAVAEPLLPDVSPAPVVLVLQLTKSN
jgi:malonyl-CoA O-methyltransferase